MGGNVFADKTSSIKREHITPTLTAYFAELTKLFPAKSHIFNTSHFIPLGSVGKKSVSGDIDLGIEINDLIDLKDMYGTLETWDLSNIEFLEEYARLVSRARTSTDDQLQTKAFLKLLTKKINSHAEDVFCDEKKVTDGNIFSLYPQYDEAGVKLDTGVQIDWMVGNLEWLKFSYYSAAYPEDSNIKGLHRTQLMLSAFSVAGLSFNHVTGVKDKNGGEVVAVSPSGALAVLGARLGFEVSEENAADYYKLYALLVENLDPDQINRLLSTYFKILDSTRVDIPDNLTYTWLMYKDNLGLTGKFLPDSSELRDFL